MVSSPSSADSCLPLEFKQMIDEEKRRRASNEKDNLLDYARSESMKPKMMMKNNMEALKSQILFRKKVLCEDKKEANFAYEEESSSEEESEDDDQEEKEEECI